MSEYLKRVASNQRAKQKELMSNSTASSDAVTEGSTPARKSSAYLQRVADNQRVKQQKLASEAATSKKTASGTGRKQTLENRVESGNAKTSDYQSLLKMADTSVASAKKTFGEAQKKYTNLSRAHDAKASLEAGREFGAATDKLQEKKIEQARAQYNYDQALRKEAQATKYDTLAKNPDFAEKSRYNATGDISNVMTRVNPTTMEVTRTGSGVDDLYYRAVNGDAKALEMIPEAKKSDSLAMSYLRDGNNISHMSEQEIANFNYLYAQDEAGGDTSHKNAWEYIEFITPDLNKRQRELTEKQAAEYADEHPIGSSLTSIAMSVPKGASYVGQAIDYFDDGKLDQNANYNRYSYTQSAIREEVGNIVENKWGATGSFLYQTGMSMGDFLFGALMGNAVGGAIGGGAKVFALGVMGTGAAADTAIEAKDSGMDDTRAFIKATVAGSAEILTENMGWDALFDKALLGKSAFTYIAKNILSEGFEEGSSDIINWVADDLYDIISGQTQSEWKQQIYEYMNFGYSYEEACGLAIGARYQELGLDMLGGALSGGIMASVGAGINSAVNKNKLTTTETAQQEKQPVDFAAKLIESGLDKKASKSLAQSIQMTLDGEEITGRTASKIALNPAALSLLEETAGVEINRDVPLSELKSQIKSIAETAKARQTTATQEQAAQGENLNATSEITPIEAQSLSERTTDKLNDIDDIIDNSNANINAVDNNPAVDETGTNISNAVNSTVDTIQNSTNNTISTTSTNAENSNARSAAIIKADRAYMKRAGAIFGENGAKAINTAYDSAVASQYAADDIIKGFSRVYNAVLSGNDAPNVDIPESVRTAAIGAAQLDAERAASAKSYSGEGENKSGLVRDINLKKASTTRTQRKVLDHVGKALGVQVRLVDSIIDENGQSANGQYQDGVLFISLKSDDPLLTTAIHEAVHRIRETSPASYQELSQFVREALTDRSMRDVFLPGYKQIYQNSDAGYLTEEIVADAMGRVMSDERAVRRFTEMHRDLAKTLRDMLSDIVATIKRAVRGQKDIELSDVQKSNMREVYARMDEAVKLFDKALEETAKKQSANKNTAGAEGKGGNISYSSVAENSENRYKGKSLFSDVSVYSYDFLTSLPDMNATFLPSIGSIKDADGKINPANIVSLGLGNATNIGEKRDGKTFVRNGYTGRLLRIDVSSIRHGLDGGGNRSLTNARLGAVIGDLAKNAVPINALNNKAVGVDGTYAMAAYAKDSNGREFVAILTVEQKYGNISNLETYDVTHAVSGRQKKTGWSDTKSQGVYPTTTGKISIRDFLKIVNSTHQSILSEDVLKNSGKSRDTNGYYTSRVRFSLSVPIEETKDLIAVHNLTEKNLTDSLKLGGLPMPSIAVVKAKSGHTKYGPISLIFGKDTINPETDSRNKVYGGDAWTPTAPRVEYEVDSKKLSQVENEIYRLSGDKSVAGGIFANSGILRSRNIENSTSEDIEQLAKRLASSETVQAAYLADNGETLEPVKQDKIWDKFGNETLNKVIDRIGVQELATIKVRLTLGENAESALGESKTVIEDILRDRYRESGEGLLQTIAKKRKWTEAEIEQKRQERINNSMERNVSISTLEDIVRHAWDMYQDGGTTKGEIDRDATKNALHDKTKNRDVAGWLEKKLDGLLGKAGIYNGKDPYNASGTSRTFAQLHYPYTLENIVKVMRTTQQERGEAVSGVSAKTLQSVATPQYKNISEIKKDSGRLGKAETDDYNAAASEIDDNIYGIIEKVKKSNKAHSDNMYIESDIIAEVMMNAAKGKKTIDAIVKSFANDGYKISTQTAKEIQQIFKAAAELPTEYFEAKPQRAVGFNEVLAAVIPDDMSAELKDVLRNAGIEILEYKAGDDESRIEKLNSVDKAKFSKKNAEVEGQMAIGLETERLLQEQMQEYEELQKENKELLLKNKRLEKENSSAELKNQTLQSKLRSEQKTSGEEIKNLKKQNKELKKSRDRWKHETKLTEKRGVDREAVQKQVRDILKSYDIPLESNEENGNLQSLTDQLQSLYDGMTFGVDENGNDFSSDDAFNMAKNIAETIAGKFTAPGEAWQNYGDLLDFVRDTPIVVSDYYHSDVNGGEHGAFRQKNFGRLKLVSEKYALKKYGRKGGMGIDVFWQYLMERYPGLFNDDAVGQTTVPEQLEYLNKVLDDVAASRYADAWEGSTDEDFDRTTTDIANDLLESFFDIPQVKKTVMDRQVERLTREFGEKADRYETRLEKKDEKLEKQKADFDDRIKTLRKKRDAKIKKLRKKNAKNIKKQLDEVREQRDKAIEKLEDKYKAKTEAGREKQKQRVLRDKITRHVSALSQKLLKATDTKHIPQELQGAVAKLLESINLESPYTIAEDGKHIPQYIKDKKSGARLENPSNAGTLTKRSEAFREMRDIYKQLEAEGTLTIDPDMQQKLDDVAAIKDVPLNLLTSDELQKIWDAVKMIESNVSKAGKTLASEKFETRLEWARDIERDAAGKRSKTSKLFKNSSSLALSLENPYTFFSHFGKSGMAIYRMLRNAQDREQIIIDRVVADTQKIAPSETVTEDMQTAHILYLGEYGEKIVLTTDQLMDLYLLTRRKAAEGHLFGGGVVQPELSGEYTLNGKKQKLDIEHGDRGIVLLKEDISYIENQLTPAQKLRAAALQNETHVLAAYGNEASMKAYGYEKFTEKDYWTIKSYSGNIRQEVGKRGEGIAAIKNVGSAKALTPNARNAVELQGVYKTFANHVSDMSTYAAWLCPMEDMNALYNFRFKDALGNDNGNIKQIIERVAGRGGDEYWTKLEGDIQNGITAKDFEPMTTFFSKSIGAFKGAAVGANLRVVIQQPTAFFRASAILSPKNMAKGIKHGVTDGNAWEKAVKYAPIAARKQMGGFDIANSGRMIDTLFDQRGKIDKLNEKLSVGAEKADEITWGKLWNACEWQTAEKYPALEAGSAEFYEKTAEIFTDTIDQSQVVDGVLQRANIMRSRNETAKQATSFMGEPLMALNMMMRAYDSIRYEKDAGRRTKAIKNAGRVATALVITNVVNALAQSLPDAWRDDDKDKKYWERFWAAFTGIDGSEETAWDKAWNFIFEGNLGGNLNLINNVPFVKDALSIMQGYDVSRTEMEIVSDFLTASETMMQAISGKSPKTAKYAFANFMAAAGKFFGLPVSNIKRDMWGLIRSAAIEAESIPLQYELEKAIYKIDDTQNKSRFLDLLYMALENNDMDAYNHIHDELMTEMQLDGKTIENGLQSRYNKHIESDSGYSLTDEQRALFGSYDKISSSGSSDSFSSADLTKEQYDAYSAQRAESWKNISDELAANYDFQDMDENTQASVLEDAYKLAQEIALQDNSNGGYEITTAWKAGYSVAEYAGIGLGEYVLYHKIWQSTDKLKNDKGNTIANSQGLLFMEKLYDIGLTKKQVNILCDCYGLSDTISDYSKKEVAAALKKMEV